MSGKTTDEVTLSLFVAPCDDVAHNSSGEKQRISGGSNALKAACAQMTLQQPLCSS
ncbi:hypothetical protein VA7868_02465 [Vibrio aerogenes CECT 7868]|uniref:Uncharacterized protein n=1 Tax=Vibrio aerogenes CECT 7868 TaxID=1216006 RepID=A0A1M5Z9Q0_9VIBR|nr:hypothetical protein VA7868_02465 [Vibrio aerogenes CECT 7868]